MSKSTVIKSILYTTLLAASLDIFAAIISFKASRGTFPVNIFKYIAGGIVGGKAMEGGAIMHFGGAFLHVFITFIWTSLYYFFYSKFQVLSKNSLLQIVLFGLFIWIVMNCIVLPLSAWKAPIVLSNKKEIAKAVFILIVCVAAPIIYRAKNFFEVNK